MLIKKPNSTTRCFYGPLASLGIALLLTSSGSFAAQDAPEQTKTSPEQVQASEAPVHPAPASTVEESPVAEPIKGHHIEKQRSEYAPRESFRTRSGNSAPSNHDRWLNSNPRYSHPIHERVHRNSWSEQVRRNEERAMAAERAGEDPRNVQYEEPRVITPDDITDDPNDWDKFYPYPRSRVLYYNDRYYSGRYYPDPNSSERETTPSAEGQSLKQPKVKPQEKVQQ